MSTVQEVIDNFHTAAVTASRNLFFRSAGTIFFNAAEDCFELQENDAWIIQFDGSVFVDSGHHVDEFSSLVEAEDFFLIWK